MVAWASTQYGAALSFGAVMLVIILVVALAQAGVKGV